MFLNLSRIRGIDITSINLIVLEIKMVMRENDKISYKLIIILFFFFVEFKGICIN